MKTKYLRNIQSPQFHTIILIHRYFIFILILHIPNQLRKDHIKPKNRSIPHFSFNLIKKLIKTTILIPLRKEDLYNTLRIFSIKTSSYNLLAFYSRQRSHLNRFKNWYINQFNILTFITIIIIQLYSLSYNILGL